MMATELTNETPLPGIRREQGPWIIASRFLRRNPLALAGVVIFLVWVFISLFADRLAPYGPLQQDIVNRLQSSSAAHWFGTDQLGMC